MHLPQIEIIHEEESQSPGGWWSFTVQVLDDDGGLHQRRVRLSWADYNLWSPSGADEPAQVAEAVIRFLLMHNQVESLPESFDASLARRLAPDADAAIPKVIHDGGM